MTYKNGTVVRRNGRMPDQVRVAKSKVSKSGTITTKISFDSGPAFITSKYNPKTGTASFTGYGVLARRVQLSKGLRPGVKLMEAIEAKMFGPVSD